MANEVRLIDANALVKNRMGYSVLIDKHTGKWPCVLLSEISQAPAVDAMVLPKGRPGDYLEWETGIIGHTTIQPINAILICEDCVRYDLGVFAPTVNHENIVRIMSREEANREIERRAKNGK